MWQRFDEEARKAVFHAQEAVEAENGRYVFPRHLLLGILKEESNAHEVLRSLGVDIHSLRLQAFSAAEDEMDVDSSRDLFKKLAPATKRVIDQAYEAFRQLRLRYIGSDALLLGVMKVRPDLFSVSYDTALEAVRVRHQGEPMVQPSRTGYALGLAMWFLLGITPHR